MTRFYLLFALVLFLLFCALEYNGTTWDSRNLGASPRYFSYRGGSSSGYHGSSGRRSSGGWYHK